MKEVIHTEDHNRRKDDRHPGQTLEWGAEKLIAAALSHMATERIGAAVVEVPGTEPQQFIAIGTAIEIGRLLPEAFGTSTTGRAAAAVRALLLELTTFDGKMVSGNHLARRAHEILAPQQAAEQKGGDT